MRPGLALWIVESAAKIPAARTEVARRPTHGKYLVRLAVEARGSSNSQRKPTGRHVLFYAVDLLELDGEEARPTYC